MAATVDALLPLSFLEAVRNIDSPQGDFEAELTHELRNKRFGLSDTVYAQIRRYTDLVKRNQRSSLEEAVALARLLGRRPDAEAVFREAGRQIARESYLTISPVRRRLMELLPSLLARPIALRQMTRIAERYLNGRVTRMGSFVLLSVPESVTLDSAPRATGCAYYESAFRELLRLLINGAGAIEHVRCGARGEGACEWRAEWKSGAR
jgi:predicted hydrocarbon binding protein